MIAEIKSSKILDSITCLDKLITQFDTMDNRLKWRLYNIAVWERIYDVEIN